MALTRAQLLMGNDQQGAVLPGEVQAVKQGAGILIDTDGTISVDASSVVGLVKLNSLTAFNDYVWPNTKGDEGQVLTMGTGNNLEWTNGGVFVSGSAPLNPEIGDLWFDCSTGQLLVYEDCTSGSPKWTSGSEGLPVLPGDTSAVPPFVSGSGTLADPYICSASSASVSGTIVVNRVTVTDLAPFQFVPIIDLNAVVNGGRFSVSNNVANVSGILIFDLLFNDSPTSGVGVTYTCALKLGYGSVYIDAPVTMTDVFVLNSPGSISGVAQVGLPLTYTPGTAAGGAPPYTPSWVWKRFGDNATLQTGGNTYTPPAGEFGNAVYVTLTIQDNEGQIVSGSTSDYGPIAKPPFPNPTPPVVPASIGVESCFTWDGADTTLESDNCLLFKVGAGSYSQGPTPITSGQTICTKWSTTAPSVCGNANSGTFIDGCLFDSLYSSCSSLTIERTPDAISILPESVAASSVATSFPVTITGNNAPAYITVAPGSTGSNYLASIDNGIFQTVPASGTGLSISSGQSLTLRFTVGPVPNDQYTFNIQLGDSTSSTSASFVVTTTNPSFPTTPITFPTATAGVGSIGTSVAWGNGTTSIQAIGCIEFSVDGGTSWVTTPTTIDDGDILLTRYSSGVTCGGAAQGELISGGITNLTFTENTSLTINRVPNPYDLGSVVGAQPSAAVTSNSINLTGFNSEAYITIDAGATLTSVSAYVNGSPAVLLPTSGTTVKILPGQTLQLEGTTGAGLLTTYSTTVKIGDGTTTQNFTWNVETANILPTIQKPSVTLPTSGTQNINPATNIPAGIPYTASAYIPLNGAGAHTSSSWQIFTNTGTCTSSPVTSAIQSTAVGPNYNAILAPFKTFQTSNVTSISGNDLIFGSSTNLAQFTIGTIIVQSSGRGTVTAVNLATNTITVGSVTGSFVTELPCVNQVTMDEAQSTQLVNNNNIALAAVTDPTANSWGITCALRGSANRSISVPARTALGSTWTVDFFVKSTVTPFSSAGGLFIPYLSTGDGFNYHVWTSSGSFITSAPKIYDVMLVGGGGGGAYHGGGGGGVVVCTNYAIAGGTHTVTVGTGGAGNGGGGRDSCVENLVAFGGGPGVPVGSPRGARGGSGIGWSNTSNSPITPVPAPDSSFGTNPTTPVALGGPFSVADTQGCNGGGRQQGNIPFGDGVSGSGGGGAGGNGGGANVGVNIPGGAGGSGRTVPQFPGPIVAVALPGVPAACAGIYGGGGGGSASNAQSGGGFIIGGGGGGAGGGGTGQGVSVSFPQPSPPATPGVNGLGGGGGGGMAAASCGGGSGTVMVRYSDAVQNYWSWTGGCFAQQLNSYTWGGVPIGTIDGNWHHIRVTNDKIYFDGVDTGVVNPLKPNLTAISYLANSSTGINPLNGELGPFRVLNNINLGTPPSNPGAVFSPTNGGKYAVDTSTTLTFEDNQNLNLIQVSDVIQEVGGTASGIVVGVDTGTNTLTVLGAGVTWTLGATVEDTSRGITLPLPGLVSTNTITAISGGGSILTLTGAGADGFLVGQTVSNGIIGSGAATGTLTAVGSSSVTVSPASANWAATQRLYRGTPVVQNLNDTSNLTSYTAPISVLNTNSAYSARVQYESAVATSAYSDWNTVQTGSNFLPLMGQAFGGGYFAGQVQIYDGITYNLYNLIVSDGTDALLHDTVGVQWSTANTAEAATNVFQNLVNGRQTAIFAASNGYNVPAYNIWQFVAAANTAAPNGYNDWYVPSAAELAIIYQNLKPGSASNVTTARLTQTNGGIGGGEGQWNTVMGNNRSSATGVPAFSSPIFTGFTAGNPAPTAVTLFGGGGVQEMITTANYWTSTEYSGGTGSVWTQSFNDGAQSPANKTSARPVRLVRRELAS